MMKKVFTVMVFFIVSVCIYAIDCPQDGMSMYFTGETRIDMGKLLQLYRCPSGHKYWVTQEQAQPSYQPSYNYGSVTCPIDGMSMYFTGKVHGMAKIYRCPSGHEAEVR